MLQKQQYQYVVQEAQFTSVCQRVEHTPELPEQAELWARKSTEEYVTAHEHPKTVREASQVI